MNKLVKVTTKIHYGEEDIEKIIDRLIKEKIQMVSLQIKNGEFKESKSSDINK